MFIFVYNTMYVCDSERDLLAEDEGKVVFSFFFVSQLFKTEPLQKAQQTLIIDRVLCPYGQNKSFVGLFKKSINH